MSQAEPREGRQSDAVAPLTGLDRLRKPFFQGPTPLAIDYRPLRDYLLHTEEHHQSTGG